MPVINNNSAAQGQAAGANVIGAYGQAYQQAAQVSMALQRMAMMEEQFKAELKMKDRVYKLREQEFKVSQRLSAQKLATADFQLKQLQQDAERQQAAREALPGQTKALGSLFTAVAAGEPDAIASQVGAFAEIAAQNPEAAKISLGFANAFGLGSVLAQTMGPKMEAAAKPLHTGPAAAAYNSLKIDGYTKAGVSDDSFKATQQEVSAQRAKLDSSLRQLSSVASEARLNFVASANDIVGDIRANLGALVSKADPSTAKKVGPLVATISKQLYSVEQAESAARLDAAKRYASEQISNSLFDIVREGATDDTIVERSHAMSMGLANDRQRQTAATIDELHKLSMTDSKLRDRIVEVDRTVGEDHKKARARLIADVKQRIQFKNLPDSVLETVFEAMFKKFFTDTTSLPAPVSPAATTPPVGTLSTGFPGSPVR